MLNTTLLLLALGVAIALADADYEPEYQHTTTTTEEPKSKALNTVLFPHYFLLASNAQLLEKWDIVISMMITVSIHCLDRDIFCNNDASVYISKIMLLCMVCYTYLTCILLSNGSKICK